MQKPLIHTQRGISGLHCGRSCAGGRWDGSISIASRGGASADQKLFPRRAVEESRILLTCVIGAPSASVVARREARRGDPKAAHIR